MEFLQYPLAFIVALGVLVAIHEYGHFWAARRIGVKVQRFSIGFGPVIKTVVDKYGTEFCLSAVPLGGYVKLLDSRIESVDEKDLDKEFSNKPLLSRVFVYAAGPAVNLLFTLAVYWVLFSIGVVRLAPIVGEVVPGSDAASANIQVKDEILSIDGEPTKGWEEVTYANINRVGDIGPMTISVKEPDSGRIIEKHVDLTGLKFEQDQDPMLAFGLKPAYQPLPAIVGEVMVGTVAEKIGLTPGDHILAIDGQPLTSWKDLVELVSTSPNVSLDLEVSRNGTNMTIVAVPELVSIQGGKSVGRLGIKPKPAEPDPYWYRKYQYGFIEAFVVAAHRTLDVIELILVSIKKMIFGHISLDNISGPITIAQVAGDTASYGLEPFMNFLAYLSVSLGVLNLLPIPMLDGGHILYALIEAVRGKPLSIKAQQRGISVGVTIIAAFMLLAFYNDIARLMG